jgi:hypothetical protein
MRWHEISASVWISKQENETDLARDRKRWVARSLNNNSVDSRSCVWGRPWMNEVSRGSHLWNDSSRAQYSSDPQSRGQIMYHSQSTDQRLTSLMNLPHIETACIQILGQHYNSRESTKRLELRRSERTNEIGVCIEVGGHLSVSLHNFVLAVGRTC